MSAVWISVSQDQVLERKTRRPRKRRRKRSRRRPKRSRAKVGRKKKHPRYVLLCLSTVSAQLIHPLRSCARVYFQWHQSDPTVYSTFNFLCSSRLFSLYVSFFQSEEDFLEESDFDDISIHSASVLSDTSGAATKKKARRGRKKRKSMFTVSLLCGVISSPSKSHWNPSAPDCLITDNEEIKILFLFI